MDTCLTKNVRFVHERNASMEENFRQIGLARIACNHEDDLSLNTERLIFLLGHLPSVPQGPSKAIKMAILMLRWEKNLTPFQKSVWLQLDEIQKEQYLANGVVQIEEACTSEKLNKSSETRVEQDAWDYNKINWDET